MRTVSKDEVLRALIRSCDCLKNSKDLNIKGKQFSAYGRPLQGKKVHRRELFVAVGSTQNNSGTTFYVGFRSRSSVDNEGGREIERILRGIAAQEKACCSKLSWGGAFDGGDQNNWPYYLELKVPSDLKHHELDNWAQEQCKLFCSCITAIIVGLAAR